LEEELVSTLGEARAVNQRMTHQIDELRSWMQQVDDNIERASTRRSTRLPTERPSTREGAGNSMIEEQTERGNREHVKTPANRRILTPRERKLLKSVTQGAPEERKVNFPAPGCIGPGMRAAGESGFLRPQGKTSVTFCAAPPGLSHRISVAHRTFNQDALRSQRALQALGRSRSNDTLESTLREDKRRCKSSCEAKRPPFTDVAIQQMVARKSRSKPVGPSLRISPFSSFRFPGGKPYNPVANFEQF